MVLFCTDELNVVLDCKGSYGVHATGCNCSSSMNGCFVIANKTMVLFRTDDPSVLSEGKGSYVVHGHWLLLQQFVAIIIKRFHYITRNWKGLFSQIILPALFICVAMTVSTAAASLCVELYSHPMLNPKYTEYTT